MPGSALEIRIFRYSSSSPQQQKEKLTCEGGLSALVYNENVGEGYIVNPLLFISETNRKNIN
jgi:hypothetical protein